MKDDNTTLESHQFEAAGHVWAFRITAGTALMLKENFAFDIRSIAEQDKLAELMDDSLGLLNLMASVLGKQLEARNMTAQELFESLNGDDVENAVYCFLAGCIGFFPERKRVPLLELLRAITTSANRLGYLMAESIREESAAVTEAAIEAIQKKTPEVLK